MSPLASWALIASVYTLLLALAIVFVRAASFLAAPGPKEPAIPPGDVPENRDGRRGEAIRPFHQPAAKGFRRSA